jgi:presenilin-like A22 family membrane protease
MPESKETKKQTEVISAQNLWKVFIIEAFLFCLTLGLGITAAFRINKILEIPVSQVSFWQFILYFLLATLLILFLVKFLKFKKGKRIIFKILFVVAIFFAGLIFLECWLPEPIPLLFLFLLFFWWWKFPSVFNQDILMILGMAGAGSALGLSLTPEVVITLLIIFSIYDFIAVYKTKHMVEMAKEMVESKAILALIVPPNISRFKESLKEIQFGGNFLILGGGDVIFPLLFCASLIPFGILNSLIIAIFSLIGLFASFCLLFHQKIRQPIPALPPIALFSIIGFLITRLI